MHLLITYFRCVCNNPGKTGHSFIGWNIVPVTDNTNNENNGENP